MDFFTAHDFERWDSTYRRTLINAISGPRSLFLMGTVHPNGQPNLGLFFNVLHVGANPPMLAVLFRPLTVPRHSYDNAFRTQSCTLNLVSEAMIPQAHLASASFADGESEFDAVGLHAEYIDGFDSPAVAESPLKLGLKPIEEHAIEANQTRLVVLQVEWMQVDSECISDEGFLRLEQMQAAVANGLDGYAGMARSRRYKYAKVGEPLIQKNM